MCNGQLECPCVYPAAAREQMSPKITCCCTGLICQFNCLVCVLSVVRQEIVATVGVCFPQSLLTLGIAGLIAQGSAALISFVGVATIAMLSRGARH